MQESDAKAISPEAIQPSFFSDARGNLKYTNFIVKYPCVNFLLTCVFCLIATVFFSTTIAAQEENIFSQSLEYDPHDKRSIVYDTMKNAFMEIEGTVPHDELATMPADYVAPEEQPARVQEDWGDFTYWIYEAESPGGLMTTKNLELMRKAEHIMLSHPRWDQFCQKEYNETSGADLGCIKPSSMLNMYYASTWDHSLTDDIVARLGATQDVAFDLSALVEDAEAQQGQSDTVFTAQTFMTMINSLDFQLTITLEQAQAAVAGGDTDGDGTVSKAEGYIFPIPLVGTTLYNFMAWCVEYNFGCDAYGEVLVNAATNLDWGRKLHDEMEHVADQWDGKGSLNPDPAKVSLFAAHMKGVATKVWRVDFYYDKKFSLENPESHYSRSFVLWGSPLSETTLKWCADQKYIKSGKGGGGKGRGRRLAMMGKGAPDEVRNAVVAQIQAQKQESQRRRRRLDEEDDDEDDDGTWDCRVAFVMDQMLSDMDEMATDSTYASINAYYFMIALIWDVFLQILIRDSALVGSVLFVIYFYLRFMVGSWFLATVGMAEIVLSIPTAMFLMRTISQLKYFAGLNMMCIFIVAAIGADDIFVFMDAYKASAFVPECLVDLETRMSWVYRRAGLAMLITSCTTCSAFLSLAVAPIPDVQSFGIFAALVILMDYVLVMSLFCTAVTIYHNRFEGRRSKNFCACCCVDSCDCCSDVPAPWRPTNLLVASKTQGLPAPQPDRMVRFFKGPFASFILSVKGRAIVVVVYLALMIPNFVYFSRLKATTKAQQFLDKDHPLQRAVSILSSKFPQATDDSGLGVYFAFGLKTMDRTDVNIMLDPKSPSEGLRWDKGFHEAFQGKECRDALKDLCHDLIYNDEFKEVIKRTPEGYGVVWCPLLDPRLDELGWAPEWPTSDPASKEELSAAIEKYVGEGMAIGGSDKFPDNVMPAHEALYGEEDTVMGYNWKTHQVQFWMISVESAKLDRWGMDAREKTRKSYQDMNQIAHRINKGPAGQKCGKVIQADVKGGFHEEMEEDVDTKWIFMNNQRLYEVLAQQGAMLGPIIAFVVLMIATRRPVIAAAASLTIFSVLVCVVGFMTIIWENEQNDTNALDSTNAIMIAILAGFAVDYVVHLAHAFSHADHLPHEERIRSAFAEMGMTVLSGALTSIWASIPLMFCQITFFQRFGQFLFFTILFSYIWANTFFMGMIASLKGWVDFPYPKKALALEASGESPPDDEKVYDLCCKGVCKRTPPPAEQAAGQMMQMQQMHMAQAMPYSSQQVEMVQNGGQPATGYSPPGANGVVPERPGKW